ncbi:MAG: hypothetical protein GQ558_05980 [Thermoplasmata archaeon]|nr:hypothetical protein [Thermoplasmata archaeon]
MLSGNDKVVITGGDIDRDRHTTWNKTWVVVVVLLLLLFSITWVFTRPIFEPEEEEEPYAWELPAEPMIISKDTTWTGQTLKLDKPIVIQEGATLRIEDIEVQVDLLDLVFWQRPAIRVHNGGALEVVNSRIVIKEIVPAKSTVVGSFWLQEDTVPNLARLVNLGNATEPALVFNYTSRYAPVPIAIGVLPEHGGAIDVVSVFEPDDSDVGKWKTVVASLKDYAGTRPHVVIFPQRFPEGLMFVSDLRVAEDAWSDAPPQGDWFPTGNPALDGWEMWGFNDLGWMMESYVNGSHSSPGLENLWKGLIEADGDVTIEGSIVSAPDDLARRGAKDRVKESLEMDPAFEILGTATRGGHIYVNGSRLTIRASDIINVPILCNGTIVDAEDSEIFGDGDLLTMNHSRGTLENVDFTMREPAQGLPFRDEDMRPQWGLGIEGVQHTLESSWTEVLNCTFTDCQQALDLSHAIVKLAGCEFVDTKQLTIWDHRTFLFNLEGGVYDGWDEIEGANTFSGGGGDMYLKTMSVHVFFEDPSHGDLNLSVKEVNGPFHNLPLYSPPYWHLLSREDNRAMVITPVLLIDSDRLSYEQETVWLSVEISRQWPFDTLYPEFNVTAGSVIVDLSADHPHPNPRSPIDLSYLDKVWSNEIGEFEVFFDVEPIQKPGYNLTVVVDLDGEQHNETVISPSYPTPHVSVSFNFIFMPGLHRLNATLIGVHEDDLNGIAEPLVEMNYTIIRLEGDMRDLPEHTLFEVDAVVVEAGTDVLLGSISPRFTDEWLWRISMTGLYDSSVSIEGIEVPKGGYLDMRVKGISLNLTNASLPNLSIIHSRNGFKDGWEFTMEVSDSNFGSLSYSGSSRVRLSNVTTHDHLRIEQSSDKGLEVTHCSIGGWGGRIQKLSADVSIWDCVVSTEVGGGLVVEVESGGSLKIIGCRFLNSHLAIYRPAETFDRETEVQVTDCEFLGDGAILYVGFNLQRMTTFDVDPDFVPPIVGTIEGNLFDGEGAGVVLYHGLFEGLYHDNTLENGARAHAYYILILRVMDTEGTPPRPEFWIVPTDTITPSTLFSDNRYLTLEGEMMLDVTDDLSVENDPPDVGVVLTAGYRPDSKVRGFASIYPLVDAGEITLAARVPFEEFLLDHVTDWPNSD